MFTSIKAYLYGGMAVIILGLGATIWIQSGKIDRLKAEIKALQIDVATAVDANKSNQETMTDLREEIAKSGNLCEQRLHARDILNKKLRDIDNLSGGNHEQNGGVIVAGTGAGNTDGDNALLSALNGMLPGQGSGEDGVYKAVSAESTSGAALLPGQLGYCIDEVNSKNLLKNVVLLRSWALDMQTILTSLQTGTP